MIRSIQIWMNGMVGVFDERGEQLSDFQGAWNDKKELILSEVKKQSIPPGIYIGIWNDWNENIAIGTAERLSITPVT